ncbi:MFS transporter [Aeoliella mucimassa]|uniref:Lysophospholipid transporter LplT n=1 Tax=Aeoliella mucimassa TaxID=2527972 RepID=A0A518ANQ1_9BACT|nr:MFS transporter [Aeoliella mucimassa]QDU56352.1 Lysophospholipid transporter LplT [Aeoliella mucimassa]
MNTDQPTEDNPYSAPQASDPAPSSPAAAEGTHSHANQPELLADRCFWGMAITQFMGAFNDNLFKQLLLLLATPTLVKNAVDTSGDRQAEATIVFAASFLIFSGVAGWLADRTSKRSLIIASKVAEVVVMVAGMVGFFYYNVIGFNGMLVVLFLMGVQSAFFGPPKYGILPEAIRARDLPRANGIFLMFTFIAIIFGMGLAGLLIQEGVPREQAAAGVWRGSGICVGIAVIGTLTSLMVWRVPAATPGTPLRMQDLFVPGDIVRLVLRNRQIMLALLVTSTFWMLGSVVQQGVNSLGKTQLGLNNTWTSVLAAMMAVGIPIGCVVGGLLSKNSINPRVVSTGAIGMVVCLILLAIPGGPKHHLLGFAGSIPVLVLLGFFTGMFVVPIQVSLQVLPPPEDKGRMIAVMNQCNFIGIILGGVIFMIVIKVLEAADWPRNLTFVVTALMMLPIALFYRPEERQLSDD